MHKPLLLLLVLVIISCANLERPPSSAPTRGVWLTNIDSKALFSKAGIEAAVDHCYKLGFNTLFVVTWNRAYTLYPSAVMAEKFGRPIDPEFAGRDPLQEVITAAHAKGMKVYAWFEFGFSSSYQESDGGALIRQFPQWAAIDSSGALVSKNGFQWMNAFDPAVQDFILALLKEVVEKYQVDGIQGDDRLPALPSEAGYDSTTLARFQHQTGRRDIPAQFDSTWIDWRAKELNHVMQRIHDEVKQIRADCQISMSPSIYPWSKEQYLQDWPTWVRNEWVDMVCPQIYRYDIDKYKAELQKITTQQMPKSSTTILSPGILLKVGDYVASDSLLQQMIHENRQNGIEGEVFFFYEGLKKRPTFFQALYP